MAFGDKGRVDADVDPLVGVVGDCQEFDDVAEFAGIFDVLGGDAGDAFDVDVVEGDPGAEGDGSQDGDFAGGVPAADVGGGVGLGVAFELGFGEDGVVVAFFGGHFAEHEVGCAVDNPHYLADPVAGQALFERPDDRYAATDAGFEQEVYGVRLGGAEQVAAVAGDDVLVGGNDVFAGRQRPEDIAFGRFFAAHQFDDDVDGRVVNDGGQVSGKGVAEVYLARLAQVADKDFFEDDGGADLLGDVMGVGGQDFGHACADGAETEHADVDGRLVRVVH